jgi:hypothetical protein
VHQQLRGKLIMPMRGRCSPCRYFAPKKIGKGLYFDGGVSHHNPGTLMLQEQRRIDPSCSRPDQLVSVGTGISTLDREEAELTPSVRVNSLYQTYQHYMRYNFDGTQQFTNMRDMIKVSVPQEDNDVDHWIRRFDLPVDGPLADLADPAAIDPLGTAAWEYFSALPLVHDLARSIIASMFYFQLRRMPVYEKGGYTCYGRIRCRIPITHPGFSSLMHKLDSLSCTFSVQGRTLTHNGSRFDRLGNFSKPVCVYVSTFDEPVHTRLKFGNTRPYYVSASPKSVQSLVKLQKLDWPGARMGALAKGPLKRRRPLEGYIRKQRRRVSVHSRHATQTVGLVAKDDTTPLHHAHL